MNWTPYIGLAIVLLFLLVGVTAFMRWEKRTFGRLAPTLNGEDKSFEQSRLRRYFEIVVIALITAWIVFMVLAEIYEAIFGPFI